MIQLSIHLEEDEYEALTRIKERYDLTWASMLKNADFSHLAAGETYAAGAYDEAEPVPGGDA